MNTARSRLAWPAFPGPVFRRELGSAARGRWLYLIRALAAGSLAFYVGASGPLREGMAEGGDWSVKQVAEMAARAFRSFESSQFVLVLALAPLLVAGSVAEEKARGTLGLILAGRLGSLEIVADKLAARLLMVLVLVVAGLPVLALIGLLGGVDPGELLMVYGLTLSSAWFSASLSMLVSVHARSASGAIVGAYAAGFAWFVLSVWFAAWLGTTGPPGFEAWLRAVAREVARSSPLSFLWARDLWGNWVFTLRGRDQMIQEMAGLQMLGGLGLLALAAWRLRPVYRAQVGGARGNRLGWLARVAGLKGRSRPPCGDDAMAWKERHAPESAWLARLALLVGLALVAQAIRFHFFMYPQPLDLAFDELFTYGLDLGPWGSHGGYRNNLNHLLCEQAAILFGASLMASTILSASSIAGERARGTWSGLLGTPLDRRGILRTKMWGAVRPVRVLLGLMLVFYLASMAATALHPVGFVLVLTAAAASLWSAVALGTWVSAQSKNAGQAIGRTVVLLLAVNSVPPLALYPFVGELSVVLSTPVLLALTPISWMQIHLMTHPSLNRAIPNEPSAGLLLLLVSGAIVAHAVGAWLLTRAAARRIERDEG